MSFFTRNCRGRRSAAARLGSRCAPFSKMRGFYECLCTRIAYVGSTKAPYREKTVQITVGVGLAQLTRSCGSCGLAIRLAILHTIVRVGHSSHDRADPHNHPVGPQDHAGQPLFRGQITVGVGLAQLTRSCGPTRSCGLAKSAILHIVQVGHSSHDRADPHNHPVGPQDHGSAIVQARSHNRCGSAHSSHDQCRLHTTILCGSSSASSHDRAD